MEESSDIDLWHQTALGSEASFSMLFERHASAVYNYCFRRVANWATAEDLMSATFLEAWRRRDEVEMTRGSVRPWLLGVATNLMRNDWRSTRRREAAMKRVALTTPMSTDGPADEVAERIDDERRMSELSQALSRLPIEQQEVVALVLWTELSYDDAAIALGVPVGTVKSRLSRARHSLKELSADIGHDMDTNNALARASVQQPSEVKG
jgi:RNA polymerase sigma-70 factor (ECF subfamily)